MLDFHTLLTMTSCIKNLLPELNCINYGFYVVYGFESAVIL